MRILDCRRKSQCTARVLIALALVEFTAQTMPGANQSKIGAIGKAGSIEAGKWALDRNGNNAWDGTVTDGSYFWSTGDPAEIPVQGDWNGDGTTKMGVYLNGTWLLDYNGDGVWDAGDLTIVFGNGDYTPIVGDWNHSGFSKIGLYKINEPSQGTFLLDYNGNGVWNDGVDINCTWRSTTAGDKPVIGDWTHDGKAKIGIFTVDGTWILDYDGNFAWTPQGGDKVLNWTTQPVVGKPVVGDWNGDGKTKIGVYYNGTWIVDYNGNYAWDGTTVDKLTYFGGPDYVPLVGDWNADGATKIAAYQSASGTWAIDLNGNWNWDQPPDILTNFGGPDYVPIVGAWPGPDFTFTTSQNTFGVVTGSTSTPSYTLTVTPLSGFSGVVSFTALASPIFYGCGIVTFSPASVTGPPWTTTLSMSCYEQYLNYYTTTVQASGGGISHQLTLALSVSSSQQYSLTTTPSQQGAGTVTPSGGLYNTGTQVTVTAVPSAGFHFTGFTGSVTSGSNPLTLTMNNSMALTANFAATETQYLASSIADLNTCLKNITYSTCVLAANSTSYPVTSSILIKRSNVTLAGGSNNRQQTRIVRDPAFTGELIKIDADTPLSGIVLRDFTVCGASNITPHNGVVQTSPVGCPPRVPTVCGDRTVLQTQHPNPFPDDPNNQNFVNSQNAILKLPQCVDVSVLHAKLPSFPIEPFNNPPSAYAVEFSNVDLEDATGHALQLWGYNDPRLNPNLPDMSKPVNDIYFHDSAINYSGVTGILIGVGGAGYIRKKCDSYPDPIRGFADDPFVYLPRNLRIENNNFSNNNTGVIGGGARWVRLRGTNTTSWNTFTNNYIWPQAQGGQNADGSGNPDIAAGGTIEFDACSDHVEISHNKFFGPGTAHTETGPLELYGRYITADSNVISGYVHEAISANSLFHSTFYNNSITYDAVSPPPEEAIVVRTAGASGGCSDQPLNTFRDTDSVTIYNNSLTLGSTAPKYGVHLADHPVKGTGVMRNVSIGSNALNATTALIQQEPFVWANSFNGYSGPLPSLNIPSISPGATPKALAVDPVSSSTDALCSSKGVVEDFIFSAIDDTDGDTNVLPDNQHPGPNYGTPNYAGANQVYWIEAVFSHAAPPLPLWQASDCHILIYFNDTKTVWLDIPDSNGNVTWNAGTSIVGTGGHDLTNPGGCIVHAAANPAPVAALPGQYNASVKLRIEFLGGLSKKHVYMNVLNKNAFYSYANFDANNPTKIVNWDYWGWWQWQ